MQCNVNALESANAGEAATVTPPSEGAREVFAPLPRSGFPPLPVKGLESECELSAGEQRSVSLTGRLGLYRNSSQQTYFIM